MAQIGVCYGMIGTGLPSPSDAIALFNQYNIRKIRMYYTDTPTLQALSGTNIQVMLDVDNRELQSVAKSQTNANSWVRSRIQNYNNVQFRYISVGNEVSPYRDSSQYVPYVLPALNNIYNAIQSAGLGRKIRVSTALDMGLLGNSYPPADGKFKAAVNYYVDPIIQFLVRTNAPLFFNIYPYFAHIDSPQAISLDYALGSSGIVVPGGIWYQNIFSAMLDAVYAAVERKGGSSLEVVVSESGWPSSGGTATTVDNANKYYNNLIQSVRNGTPKRPGKAIETYLFAMFDENGKNPKNARNSEHEKYFGLFRANKEAKYQINFNS